MILTLVGTAGKRHQYAGTGDRQRLGACPQQVAQIRSQSCREHQQHHADLGADVDEAVELNPAEHAGTDEQSGDDLADDLRRSELTGDQSENFGKKNDYRQIPHDRQYIHNNRLFSIVKSLCIYVTPDLTFCQNEKTPEIPGFFRYYSMTQRL